VKQSSNSSYATGGFAFEDCTSEALLSVGDAIVQKYGQNIFTCRVFLQMRQETNLEAVTGGRINDEFI
jgi:hypothetical protein